MTKINYSLTIIFLFCIFHANAQQNYVDSLKQQLAATNADNVKIDLTYQLSRAYSNTNIDSMVFYSKQTIHLLHHSMTTEKADSNKLQILLWICEMNQYVSSDSMVYYAQQAVMFSLKKKDILPTGTEAMSLLNLAYSMWWAGNFPDAKETYFKALKLAETLGDTLLIGRIYDGIALVNRSAGDNHQAINYYTRAENLTKHIPDNDILFSALVDKGVSYEQLDILDSAYTYVQECLAMQFRKFKGKNIYGGGTHAEMGIIYSKMGKEQLAIEFFRQSFQLNSEVNNIRLLAGGYCSFAQHFDRFHQADSAIYYATNAFLIDKQFNLLAQQVQASTLLTKLYKQENKIDSAFKYQQLMIDLRDSIFSREKTNRLQTLEFNEQLRQQSLETEKIKYEEERKQNIQYVLIALGIISFIILFLLLSRSFITNTKLIEFFSVMALLIVFEFLNLLLHPYLERVTGHTPLMMLLALVCIAALLIPLHHRIEKWSKEKLVEKNKAIRLANAKKTIVKLEGQTVIAKEGSTNA
jgi:tetratricopeptide (TPR) repeat protein